MPGVARITRFISRLSWWVNRLDMSEASADRSRSLDSNARRQTASATASITRPRRTSTTRYRVRHRRCVYIAHTNHGSQGFCKIPCDGNRNRTWANLLTVHICSQVGLMSNVQRQIRSNIRSGWVFAEYDGRGILTRLGAVGFEVRVIQVNKADFNSNWSVVCRARPLSSLAPSALVPQRLDGRRGTKPSFFLCWPTLRQLGDNNTSNVSGSDSTFSPSSLPRIGV